MKVYVGGKGNKRNVLLVTQIARYAELLPEGVTLNTT